MRAMNLYERPKVAIYCRLSDEDHNKKNPEEDSRSIQTQKAMLRDYAHEQGWEIYDIYSDDDYSGQIPAARNTIVCWKMQRKENSTLFCVSISPVLPGTWYMLRHT